MRQIDYIIEENKVIKKLRKMGSSVTKGVKKFFAPLTPEEREAAGLQDRHKYLTGGDVKPLPTPKKFKADKSGTVRSADSYGEGEIKPLSLTKRAKAPVKKAPVEKTNEAQEEHNEKAGAAQRSISDITRELSQLRRNWDANSSVKRAARRRLAAERDEHVEAARGEAHAKEEEDKARVTGK
tara:strand:+ start:911 stop:1456 length:546 start_codon:yes stop_codon:yes gene_type:complete